MCAKKKLDKVKLAVPCVLKIFPFFLTDIQYSDIARLLIYDTDINQYQHMRSWHQHITSLYCDILLMSPVTNKLLAATLL